MAALWPGPDLRPPPGTQPSRFDYGVLPPRFFAYIRDKILQAHLHRKPSRVYQSSALSSTRTMGSGWDLI
jgi:hypothetical protein